MKTLCLTSSAWLGYRKRCIDLLERVMRDFSGDADSIVIDLNTVLRENSCSNNESNFSFCEIDLRMWINETITEGGVVNIEAVRRAAIGMSPKETVLINATGFTPETIGRVLTQLRIGLYSLSEWPQGIAVVCDDAQLYQLSPALAHAFYLRPSIMTKTAVLRLVRRVRREALLLKILGKGIGSMPAIIRGFFRWFWTREDRKISKKLGWVWEE